MKTLPLFAGLAFLAFAGPASAQGLILPPDQQQLNAQTQQQLNNQLTQTQLQNLQTQQSIQENENRQQQIFNSQPPPGYMQNQYPAQPGK